MERNFLGIGGQQNSGALMKKENRGGRAISIGSPAPWPFSNKACSLEQFMSFQPISPEKSLGVERHSYQNQDAYRASTRQLSDARFATVKPHSSVPIAMTSPFLKQQPTLTPRNVMKPQKKKAQLTIFYAGSVNVYDDVSCDMAKSILLMASKECEPAVHQRPEASKGMISTVTSTDHVVHQCSGLSSTVSIAEPGSGPAPTNETVSISLGAAAAAMPKAVPQARKASLARFLEKRKERVSNMMPYSCEKKTSDNSNGIDDGTRSSKCSSADVSILSDQGGSWCVGQTMNCSGNGYYPGIKLEM